MTEAMAAKNYTDAYCELVAKSALPKRLLGNTVTLEQLQDIKLAPDATRLWNDLSTTDAK